MDIPAEIEEEIRNSILEHGACGEVEYTDKLEEGLQKQSSDLSFCDTEYIKQTITGISGNEAECVAYFPFGEGYLKAPYVL